MSHEAKKSRREPLAPYERTNMSPMAISPTPVVTPPRQLSLCKGSSSGSIVTPQRGTCTQSSAIGVQWGICSSRGPRQRMEDFAVATADDGNAIFGVFDGHGGTFSAEYCQQQLHRAIRTQPSFPFDMPTAIKYGYLQTDQRLIEELIRNEQSGGACALVAVITQSTIAIGNAGDCRAVYSCGDQVLELSQDHTADNETEARRAVAAGGIVEFGFVQLPDDGDQLPVTRALGDVRMKAVHAKDRLVPEMQIVSSMPEVCVVQRSTSACGFLILATDGLWSCCTSADAVSFVELQLQLHEDPQWAADQLVAHAMNECNSDDNLYAIVVLLRPVALASTPAMQPRAQAGGARSGLVRQSSDSFTPPTNSPADALRHDDEPRARERRVPLVAPAVGVFAAAVLQSVRVGES